MSLKKSETIVDYIKKEMNAIFRLVMSKGCIIHIGMHKTGSSSIQANLNNLQDSRFYYARLGNPNHGIPIYCLFSKNPESHYALSDLTKEQIIKTKIDISDMLLKSIKEAGNRCLIISGEDICYLSELELGELKNFLETEGNKYIKVLGYIREPYGYMSSAFQEILKLSFIPLNELENRVYPNYRKRFEKFYTVFGEENVIFKKFDTGMFPNGDVVLDFCETIGLKISNQRIKKINRSYPKEIVSLFYLLRKYNPDLPNLESFGQNLKSLFNGLSLNKFRISSALLKPIVDKNSADIKWIEEKIGEPLLDQSKEGFGSITDETELLTIPEQILNRLIEFTSYPHSKNKKKFEPEEIAEIAYASFKKNIGEQYQFSTFRRPKKLSKQTRTIKKTELVNILTNIIVAKYNNPVIKKAIPDIVTQIFFLINEELKKGNNIHIDSFGVFRISELQRKRKDVSRKVIRFIP